MEIYLKDVILENDFFTVGTPDWGTLRLNKIDEKLNVRVLLKDVEINRINIEYESSEGTVTLCSSIIGLSNNLMEIQTNIRELEGEVLTAENMQYCTIVVYE